MTILQSSSPVSTVSPSVPLRGRHTAHRRQVSRETGSLTLEQQGVRAEWFTRGIEESNCALFHASLYPILPRLKDRIQSWLKSNSAVPSMARDQIIIADFAMGVIVSAFEKGHQWQQDQSVLDWLAGFIPVVYAESDPT